MNPLALPAFGLLLGLRHAADPDHVMAVTAIAARGRPVLPVRGGLTRRGPLPNLACNVRFRAPGASRRRNPNLQRSHP